MDNLYIYFIVALLPISALMLMIQVNPYQALVIRGIFGAIAVLSYIVLGAADVALTEALMGTLLGVALYIIAVRSSFVIRLGVLENQHHQRKDDSDFSMIIKQLKDIINQLYLRLELVSYPDKESLTNALNNKEIHGYMINNLQEETYLLNIRIKRLFSLITKQINHQKLAINYQDYNQLLKENKSWEIANKSTL